MTSLEYLDLNEVWIRGFIPSAFGNMHSLSHLNLQLNGLQGPIPVTFGDMHSLSFLDLSFNRLQGSAPTELGNMHSLSYIDLSSNTLEGLLPGSIFQLNLLEHLVLSNNNFRGILFSNSTRGGLCRLQTLDLSNNIIINDFSSILQTFSGCANNSLVVLDVSNNSFWGSIPNTIGAFSSLQTLHLNKNQLNGTISPSLGQLSGTELLDFSSNSLRGTLSNHHLSNLSRLNHLDLQDNPQLIVSITADWIPPFQLDFLSLRSCKSSSFPKWLLTQANVSHIDISSNGISDAIPTSFWNLFSDKLKYLNLSNNKIHGLLPHMPPTIDFIQIDVLSPYHIDAQKVDLSSNRLEGSIPSFLGNATVLLLNDNRFSGSLTSFCPKTKALVTFFDLSNNFLHGELPDCWQSFYNLEGLRLDNNNFTGKLPSSMGALNLLEFLSMRNNGFNGELPVPLLENWTNLLFLDLAHNSFRGHIPVDIGSILKDIHILDLRSNKFIGKLPSSLCELSQLQVLDLSYNQISGTIPECICHLQAMTSPADYQQRYTPSIHYGDGGHGDYSEYSLSDEIMWKRKEQRFADTLGLVNYLAISDNQLQGEIPSGILCLRGLGSLDLARNNLKGLIPSKIGELTSLEFLDLSRNHLSGQIPSSLANLHFLGTLDLSYNNLSGRIPTGTQLQGLDPVSYVGNPGLCGPPLQECTRDPALSVPKGTTFPQEENDSDNMFPGLYASVVLGFIVGFWGVFGTLVIKKSWRHAYFRFVEDVYDRLYVMVVVTIPRVWRRP